MGSWSFAVKSLLAKEDTMIEKLWRNLLTEDELGNTIVASCEFDDLVCLMVECEIDPQKFIGNLSALTSRGMPDLFDLDKPPLPRTPSVDQYISLVNRPPGSPLWLLAGFPDINAWIEETPTSELFDFDDDALQDLSESDLRNPDGSFRVFLHRNLILNYVAKTGKKLEVAVEEGSEDNIYLGNQLLQMTGEESNFTLIATVATKYYMELKTNYATSFPNETAFLAMSGILDANFYILSTGQIQPAQIVDLARSSQENEDPLLEFIILLEALLLSLDTPDLAHDEVLAACRDQAEAIERSIRNTMEMYRGEPQIANATRAFMTSTQFSHLRNAAGVHKLTLLDKLKNMISG
jgi:hypothetical protein